jgi:predicted MPP superfamily phosphohydrolase
VQQVTWLHLSDWHQKGSDFGRKVVREALIKDIRDRQRIAPELATVDFVVFSGDLAYSGAAAEYEAAQKQLLDPVLEAAGVGPDRLVIVPGNHDLDREYMWEMAPKDLRTPLNSEALVQKWLADERLEKPLEPFKAYRNFVSKYTGLTTPDYAAVFRFDVRGTKVGVLGLNSAWMTGRNKNIDGEVNDYGFTLIGEPQVHDALKQIAEDNLRIAVMHHPFEWTSPFDRNRTEGRLRRGCHFILCGHVHDAQVQVVDGTSGDAVMIPAGASWDRRVANDPRYINAYNWVHLDLDANEGRVYLRQWGDKRDEWIEDTHTYPEGKFTLKSLPKKLHKPKTEASVATSSSVEASATSRFERERQVLEGYLQALIRNNTDLEPGGIKQTKVHVVLPLDSIYVGLQADRDRPDVDRRVMQEELDEIKKNLEREEDPKEREKQYQIWAHHSRVIQKALEISGPREELSTIVQRHRQVVILGDPGSGKTTLLRYLTLCLARAVLAAPERLFERQELWDQTKVWSLPDLGPVRVPILLRISNYAEARQTHPDLALVDYLPRYFAGMSVPNPEELGALLQMLLDQGRCMVLFDGLDEIIDPTDRRKIAAAIGQFANVYRETGLPDWLAHLLSQTPARTKERLEVQARGIQQDETLDLQWASDTPEDVREEWGKRIKQRRQEWQRRGRAVRMAWELLDEARYAHVGNRFVVTSRIAGYHFAGVPGEFEHFTIRRMSLDDIKLFLEKWCPAVERQIAQAPDAEQVEQRSRREIDGILKAVETTPGVRRMAENPLLLRILAIIHRNEAHLPQRRVELYETASVTLLRDWHLERGTAKAAVIDDVKATSLLGPLALYIHENRASGFLSKGETERILGGILARERGEKDPDQPSLETREAVQDFLETVREHSGLFVERGEGLYGFMHLTFEEYFTARQLVSSASRAQGQILERLHQPRWREPILLAVGSLSKQFYDDTQDLLLAILDASSAHEEVLHRDLLFAASCIGDSVNVAPVLRYKIAQRLLDLYCDRRGAGRFSLLQKQVKDALLTLCNDQGDAAVENALAHTLKSCGGGSSFKCALDVVEWLSARTPAVAEALATNSCLDEVPRADALLRAVLGRISSSRTGGNATPTGWVAVRTNAEVAGLLGALWRYGWSDFLIPGLGIPDESLSSALHEMRTYASGDAVNSSQELLQMFHHIPPDERSPTFWNTVIERLREIWTISPGRSEIEAAAKLFAQQIVDLPDFTGDIGVALRFVQPSEGFLSEPDEASTSLTIESARAQFADVVGVTAAALAVTTLDRQLVLAGFHLLNGVKAGDTLAATFAARANVFDSFKSAIDNDRLTALAQATHLDIARVLLNSLRTPISAQHYQEAAGCILSESWPRISSDHDSADEVRSILVEAAQIVDEDLTSDDSARSVMALRTFVSMINGRRRELNNERRSLVLRLLDSSNAQAALALEILFSNPLSADLLSWCWSALRAPNHPLKDIIVEHLDSVGQVSGYRDVLLLIDEGLRDKSLRPYSIELLHKVAWRANDTFTQALTWLTDPDSTVRHLGAILIAGQEDLLAVPKGALADVARDAPVDPTEKWSSFHGDGPMVRLLTGLWLNGWDSVLSLLWTGKSAGSYLMKTMGMSWSQFTRYPESDKAIHSLLDNAQFGQILMPLFKDAAIRLAKLEGDSIQDEPTPEHIGIIQEELIAQVGSLLNSPETPPASIVDLISFCYAVQNEQLLIPLCKADHDHPLAAWLHQTLAETGTNPNSNVVQLTALLTHDSFSVRAAAAASLVCADIPTLLLLGLMEAAESQDDRLRTKGRHFLISIGSKLHCDGSTNAPEILVDRYREAQAGDDGVAEVVLFNSIIGLNHDKPFWIDRWLNFNSDDENAKQLALLGLSNINNTSQAVLAKICTVLNDSNRPLEVRRAIAYAINNMMRLVERLQSNETILAALTTALSDADDNIRNNAAHALQWTIGQVAWTAAVALQQIVTNHPDLRTRRIALVSLGRALHTVRGFRDVDLSTDALLRWLEKQSEEEMRFGSDETGLAVRALAKRLNNKTAPDSQAVLNKLSEPETLGISKAQAAHLINSAKWRELVKKARQEWSLRNYWLEKLPFLPSAIKQVEKILSEAESGSDLQRAAARALAWIYHGEEDRPIRLREVIPDDSTVLRAMLDASANGDTWIDEGALISNHPWAIKQIVGWLEAKSAEERGPLIDSMMELLDKQLSFAAEGAEESTEGYYGWPIRRILMAVLAELSERLTYRAFIHSRELTSVIDLFARAANDRQDHDGRRFAIRALGNLQQLTRRVADVFFAACRDVPVVYNETRVAVTKFKVFDSRSLERLTAAIKEPSITVAYHATLLLGELGVSRSEDLGLEGRKRVADELVQLLDAQIAERMVYDFTLSVYGSRVGPLYDVIYDALVRVVAGPDAPVQVTEG